MTISNGRWTGPILDNHFHLDRSHLFMEAARQFQRVGGTDLVLVHKPDFTALPIEVDGWREAYVDTVTMAEQVRSQLGLNVRVVLGPHPASWAHQHQALGGELADELYRDAVDLAFEFCNEGLACAVGEVGRPHWKVEDDIWEAANELLEWTMMRAVEEGYALQLHVEEEGAETYADLAAIADRTGLSRDRLVRHHAPPELDSATLSGLIPSVVVGKGSLDVMMETIEKGTRFLMETDYMDDPRRPGAVLGPRTVPRRTQSLVEAGIDEEYLWIAHQDLAEQLYGPAE